MDEEREKQIQEMTDKIFNEMKEKEASQQVENSSPQPSSPTPAPVQQPVGFFRQMIRTTFDVRSLSGAAIILNTISIATSLWQYRDFTLHIRECSKTDPSCGAAGGWVFFFIIIPFVMIPFAGGMLATVASIIRAFAKLAKGEKITALIAILLVIAIITAIAAIVTVRMMWTF